MSRAAFRSPLPRLLSLCLLLGSAFASHAQAAAGAALDDGRSAADAKATAAETLLHLPLAFEPAARPGAMVARAGANAVRLEPGGTATFFAARAGGKQLPDSVSLRLAGARPGAEVEGEGLQPGRLNYLLGNDSSQWRRHVARYAQARTQAVYPGIDLVYYGNGREFEHDYVLAPRADPSAIRMQFAADETALGKPVIDATGALVVRSAQHEELLRLKPPVAYQQVAGMRRPIPAAYKCSDDGTCGFTLGAYDHDAPLTIDPVITYSSYFGGSNQDAVVSMQLDSARNIYLLLQTQSIDLPTTGTSNRFCNGTCGINNPNSNPSGQPNGDWFFAKFDPTGQTLLLGTYVGGSSADFPSALAVDAAGNMYGWGSTTSSDFPVNNAYQPTAPAGLSYNNYVFSGALVKLSADGSQLLYSTFFGAGTPPFYSDGGYPVPNLLALAPNGVVYVTGYTGDSSGQTFASAKNAQFTGGYDFVAKFDTTQSGPNSLLYATPVGPPSAVNNRSQRVTVAGLAVDSKANLWLSGDTDYTVFPLATANAVQPACGSPGQCQSAYLMELDPTGQSTLYATFFGGTTNVGGGPAYEYATGLVLDAQDNIFWGGRTEDGDFPVTNPTYTAAQYAGDGWLAEFSAGGTPVLYSSYVPCTPSAIGVFRSGPDPYVSFGCSTQSRYPTQNATGGFRAGGYSSDAYFSIFDPARTGAGQIVMQSYLGTADEPTTFNTTVFDNLGNLWFGGNLNGSDLPLKNPYQATCNQCQSSTSGSADGYMTRIALVQLAPTSLAFPDTNVNATSTAMTATLQNLYGTSVKLGTATFSDATDFTQSDNCGGTLAALGTCTVTFTFTPASAGALTSTYTVPVSDSAGKLYATLSAVLTSKGLGVPNPVFSPANVAFTTTQGKYAVNQDLTLTNNGSAAIQVLQISLGGASASVYSIYGNTCTPALSIAPNASCTVTIASTASATGSTYAATLNATFSNSTLTASSSLTTVVTNPLPAAAFNPASLSFSTTANTQPANQSVTLANSGTAALSIASFTLGGTNASAFNIVSNGCGTTLAAGANCSVTLGFTGAAAGSYSASLTATDNASPTTQSVSLTGTVTGTPQAALTPAALTFSAIQGNTTAAQNATLTNSGTASLTINSVALSGTNASSFAQTNTCGTALAAGASCTVSLTFTPSVAGTFTAALSIVDSVGTQTATLSGAGTAATPADFSLTPTPAMQSTYPGQGVTYTIQAASLLAANPFIHPVTFSVTGLPAGATAGFAPATIVPGVQASTVLTVTPALSAAASRPAGLGQGRRSMGVSMAVLLACVALRRRKRRMPRTLLLLAICGLSGLALSTTGCGNGSGFRAPVSYTLVVTGTSGTTVHSTPVTLTIQ